MAYYAQLVSIDGPSEAVGGALVNIILKIKNVASYSIWVMAGGQINFGQSSENVQFYPDYTSLNAGDDFSFGGGFYMPAASVTMYGRSYYYGVDDVWHVDEEKVKVISLKQQAAAFSNLRCTISKA